MVRHQSSQDGAGQESPGKQLHMCSFLWQCKGYKIVNFKTNVNLLTNVSITKLHSPLYKGLPTLQSFSDLPTMTIPTHHNRT